MKKEIQKHQNKLKLKLKNKIYLKKYIKFNKKTYDLMY